MATEPANDQVPGERAPRTDDALRAFIFKHYSGGDIAMIDGRIFVENMDLVFKWLKDGSVPTIAKTERKRISLVTPKGDGP